LTIQTQYERGIMYMLERTKCYTQCPYLQVDCRNHALTYIHGLVDMVGDAAVCVIKSWPVEDAHSAQYPLPRSRHLMVEEARP
jgi:hypothetical protein